MFSRLFSDPTLAPAIFGLFGTLVGALISGGATMFAERLRANRERELQREQRTIELRTAARLIQQNLISSAASMKLTVEEKRFYRTSRDHVVIDGWESVRPILASNLPWDAWEASSHAVDRIISFKAFRDRQIEYGQPDIDERVLSHIEKDIKLVDEGGKALQPYVADAVH